VAAAKALGLPQQAAAVAIMTGRQESALLVLPNPAVPGSGDYPHQGSGSGHDSAGLSQQRPSQGWSSVGQLMDPGYTATTFLRNLMQIPGWQHQPLWQAAQAVQRSADGAAYAQWAALGTAVAGALWDHTGGVLSCTSGATAASFAGAGGGVDRVTPRASLTRCPRRRRSTARRASALWWPTDSATAAVLRSVVASRWTAWVSQSSCR